MELKFSVFSLILIASFQSTLGQSEYLGCNYIIDNSQYTCMLSIYNSNGLNNFQRIDGTHMAGRNDTDVITIRRESGSITKNIPSIICNTFRNAQIIYLEGIGIESVDEYSFRNCSNLLYTVLDGNNIIRVAENAFQGNLNLEGVELRRNRIRSLGENTFTNLQSLRVLWMNYNNIVELPSGIFRHLRSLKSFSLGNNQVRALKSEWFEIMEELEDINLGFNEIEQIPQNTFAPMKIVEVVNLENNKLKIVNSNAFSMHPKLRYLGLNSNQIDAIDENIIYNTAVFEIQMSGNICANLTVRDNTTSREIFRNYLRTCFNNFNQLPVGEFKI